MAGKSFSVRIYLQDGHASGVKIVSKSKWAGRGLVIPRTAFARERDREELNAPGVYVLVRQNAAAEVPRLWVGAAELVGAQLAQHDEQDDFWAEAIVFTCKEDSLDLPQAQYLAARLQQLAVNSGQAILCNPCQSRQPELAAAEIAVAETFLDHMLSLYPLFGVTAFEACAS